MRNYGNKERESYVPLNDVKVEGTAISFKLGQFAPGPDTPYYVGKLSEDGKNITGNLFFPQISAMRGLG